jgi:hypothetical protein
MAQMQIKYFHHEGKAEEQQRSPWLLFASRSATVRLVPASHLAFRVGKNSCLSNRLHPARCTDRSGRTLTAVPTFPINWKQSQTALLVPAICNRRRHGTAICTMIFGALPRHEAIGEIGTLIAISGHTQETLYMSSPVSEVLSSFRKLPQRQTPKPSAIPKTNCKPQVIDISDRRQVDHWSRYFGVSPALLCSAVMATGGVTTDVWRLLAMN